MTQADDAEEVMEEVDERPPTEVRVLRWVSVSLENPVGWYLGEAVFPCTLWLGTRRVPGSRVVSNDILFVVQDGGERRGSGSVGRTDTAAVMSTSLRMVCAQIYVLTSDIDANCCTCMCVAGVRKPLAGRGAQDDLVGDQRTKSARPTVRWVSSPGSFHYRKPLGIVLNGTTSQDEARDEGSNGRLGRGAGC
jgi:hypothetical protein